jgi:hypothetical protein
MMKGQDVPKCECGWKMEKEMWMREINDCLKVAFFVR